MFFPVDFIFPSKYQKKDQRYEYRDDGYYDMLTVVLHLNNFSTYLFYERSLQVRKKRYIKMYGIIQYVLLFCTENTRIVVYK